MSKAYGLYLGCSRAPIKRRTGSWIQTSHRRHGVEPKGSVPLWQRRGVACLAPADRVGHAGLSQGSAACNRTTKILTRFANRRLRRKTLKWHCRAPTALKKGLRNSGVTKDSKLFNRYRHKVQSFAQACGFKFATPKWFTPVRGLGPEFCHDRGLALPRPWES
jgi:hypothetical protein